jgi:hypothetical protein
MQTHHRILRIRGDHTDATCVTKSGVVHENIDWMSADVVDNSRRIVIADEVSGENRDTHTVFAFEFLRERKQPRAIARNEGQIVPLFR